MARRYRRLKGNSAYLPFAARTDLRAGQRRTAHGLRVAGLVILALAALLFMREYLMNGGQPAPVSAPTAAPVSATATPAGHRVTVVPKVATPDALAGTEETAMGEEPAVSSPLPEVTVAPAVAAEILPQYRSLYARNPQLVGWLSVPAADIELPVLCSPGENEYYLRRGFDKLYSARGSLFLDERCRLGTPDGGEAPTANWLVYGHNMADGSMLSGLTRYRDEEFYKENPTFRFDTLYESKTWQVVAALDTTLGADELPYYSFFDADTERTWQDRVDAIFELSLYDTGFAPKYGDQLLILSTCGKPVLQTDTRFALVAIPAEE